MYMMKQGGLVYCIYEVDVKSNDNIWKVDIDKEYAPSIETNFVTIMKVNDVYVIGKVTIKDGTMIFDISDVEGSMSYSEKKIYGYLTWIV